MSKIGRKPIALGNVQADVKGQEVHVKGPKGSGVLVLPDILTATVRDGSIVILPKEGIEKKRGHRELNQVWGLNRALSNPPKNIELPCLVAMNQRLRVRRGWHHTCTSIACLRQKVTG